MHHEPPPSLFQIESLLGPGDKVLNRLLNTKCCDIKLAKTCMLVRSVNSTTLKEKERAKGIIINGQRLNFMTGGKDKLGDSMYHYGVDQMFSGKAEAFILVKVDGTISAKYNVYPSVDTMTHNSTTVCQYPQRKFQLNKCKGYYIFEELKTHIPGKSEDRIKCRDPKTGRSVKNPPNQKPEDLFAQSVQQPHLKQKYLKQIIY